METSDLVAFIRDSPTPFQFGEVVRKRLLAEGFTELQEQEQWDSIPDKGFYLRDGRALVAFKKGQLESAVVVGTHCDSPALKTKPNFDIPKKNEVNIAPYGGGLWGTWYDRELRLAGRVFVKEGESIVSKLVDSIEPIAIIPSPPTNPFYGDATSMDINTQTQLVPIIGLKRCQNLRTWLADQLNVQGAQILETDLFFVDAQPPAIIGANGEFLASERIDNLLSTYAALQAFIASEPHEHMNVFVVFDNEEIGSNTRLGAQSDLLPRFFDRILPDPKKRAPFIARSLIVSSDNSHAINPNYADISESLNSPIIGKGTAVKKSPSASYATDAASSIPLRLAAKSAGTPLQNQINRNDRLGGSTIGPHISSLIGAPTVDIGMPQLAMHSIRELAATKDVETQIATLKELYEHFKDFRLA